MKSAIRIQGSKFVIDKNMSKVQRLNGYGFERINHTL